MLHPFISSQAFRIGHPGLVAASAAAHVGLVALAIAWPQRPIPAAADLARAVAEHVTWAFSGPLVDEVARTSAHGTRGRALAAGTRHGVTRDPYAELAAFQLSFTATIPDAGDMTDAGFDAATRRALAFTDSEGGDIGGTVLGRGVPKPDADGAYTEELVEKTVLPYEDNPRPVYPAPFEELGLEGSFDVLFVVDSTGRVDRHSIRFPGRVEQLLAQAVRRALERSRYFPAEVGGRRVSQLVEQRFIFRMQ